MILIRVLHAELLKMKRTMAWKLVVLAPGIVVALIVFMASQAPFSTLQRNGAGKEWTNLTRLVLLLWTLLMMPLYITLETAIVAGLDHAENQWKSLLARPVPRWTLYVAKLIIIVAMSAASMLVILIGILLAGAMLPRLQPQLTFPSPIPWAAIVRESSQIMGLGFLALTIQFWVSLRWRSFSVAIGTGIVAMILGYFAVVAGRAGDWLQYIPWALPMLVLAREPHNIEASLLIGVALSLAVAVAGCVDFCRREVS
jgi:hypothetical protein